MRKHGLIALLLLPFAAGTPASTDPGVLLLQFAEPAYQDGDLEYWANRPNVYKDARHLASLGHVKSMFNFAMMAHIRGETDEAVRWYKRAANRNHEMAAYNLASMYFSGDGVPVDREEAARWMERSARLGYTLAQFEMAKMYYHGLGVPQDHSKEAYWYRKAAENGNAAAAHNLAVLYQKGEGVEQSDELARKWLEKARSSDFHERY